MIPASENELGYIFCPIPANVNEIPQKIEGMLIHEVFKLAKYMIKPLIKNTPSNELIETKKIVT